MYVRLNNCKLSDNFDIWQCRVMLPYVCLSALHDLPFLSLPFSPYMTHTLPLSIMNTPLYHLFPYFSSSHGPHAYLSSAFSHFLFPQSSQFPTPVHPLIKLCCILSFEYSLPLLVSFSLPLPYPFVFHCLVLPSTVNSLSHYPQLQRIQ